LGKRQAIIGKDIPSHPQPFPVAIRIGNMILSSTISGEHPETRALPQDTPAEVAQAFTNMRKVVERGGGTVDDIAKVVVYLLDRKDRDIVNVEWVKMFPDESDRPVRHTITSSLPAGMKIQLEFIAIA
jgi:enamine deaminase RidA (YjgF/YER057c/UK114 family)